MRIRGAVGPNQWLDTPGEGTSGKGYFALFRFGAHGGINTKRIFTLVIAYHFGTAQVNFIFSYI